MKIVAQYNPNKEISGGLNFLLTSSSNKKRMRYKDILYRDLSNIFLNDLSLELNLKKLERLIEEQEWEINTYLLEYFPIKKSTLVKRDFTKSIKIENFVIELISEENLENGDNTIWLFFDVLKSPTDDHFSLILKRIDTFDKNISELNLKNIEIKFFSDSESFSYSEENDNNLLVLLKEGYSHTSHDDSTLKLDSWKSFIDLFLDNKDIENKIDIDNSKYIVKMNDKTFLLSKTNIDTNKKFNLISPNNVNLIKNVSISQHKEKDLNLEISSSIEEISDNLNSFNEKLSLLKNELIKTEKDIEQLNRKLSINEYLVNFLSWLLSNNTYIHISNKAKLYVPINIKKGIYNYENLDFLFKKKYENLLKKYENNIKQVKNSIDTNEDEINNLKTVLLNINLFNDLVKKFNFSFMIDLIFDDKNNELDVENTKCSIDNIDFSTNKFNFSNINLFVGKLWELQADSLAKQVLLDRYKTTLNNVVKMGIYKNPTLIRSMEKINKLDTEWLDDVHLNDDIVKKYSLNEMQESFIKKALTTNDIVYLQGPPGTGKTQTLCAVSEEILHKNKSILITSSTHEAIENYLDRLNESNLNNPNLIMFKYAFSNNQNARDSSFDEDHLYLNFIEKTINYISSKRIVHEIDINDEFRKLQDKYPDNLDKLILTYRKKIKIPNQILMFIKKYKTNFITKEDFYDNWFFDEDEPIYGVEKEQLDDIDNTIDGLCDENDTSCKSSFFKLDKNFINDFDQFINVLVKVFEEYKIYDFVWRDIKSSDSIEKKILSKIPKVKSNSKNIFDNYFKVFTNGFAKYFSNDKERKLEKIFKQLLLKNKWIQIIGLTTTSRQNISIDGNEMTLFNEYPVDWVIIDEVSKAKTPEILSKAMFAKRLLLSGDYLQLPPNNDILETDEEIEKIINNIIKFYSSKQIDESKKSLLDKNKEAFIENIFNRFKEKNHYKLDFDSIEDIKFLFELRNDNDEYREIIYKYLKTIIEEDLFNSSLFKEQIIKLKENSDIQNYPYVCLRESWRFKNKLLFDIVNVIYRNANESLSMPLELEESSSRDKGLLVLDTSKGIEYDSEFFKIHNISDELKEMMGRNSFDQSGKCFHIVNGNKRLIDPLNSSYNQYSAWLISKIVVRLLKILKGNETIAIIALTRSQKKVISHYIKYQLKNLENYKSILKVDTIDNFQGREATYVIVDFIRGERKIESTKEIKMNKNFKRNISFLSSKERINVAISRAKKEVILVGNFKNYLIDENKINTNSYTTREMIDIFDEYVRIAEKMDKYVDEPDEYIERYLAKDYE